MADRPRVLIVGAGFAGLWAARELGGEAADVTLIDRNNFHTFYPLLYQIGAAELEAVEIAYPVRGILRKHSNVRFFMAEARGLDLDGRAVETSRGRFPYDYLLLATGSVTHFFGVEGADRHAFPLRTLEEGLALRNHILARFEGAVREEDPAKRSRGLRFVIVGGGPTGVEFAGALAELVFGPLAKDFREVREEVSVVLVEARERLLPEMPERLGRYASRRLEKMGVELRLGGSVRRVTPEAVHLEDGTGIPTRTVAWTAGVRGDPDAAGWGLPTGRQGRVGTLPTLQLEGWPEVYVAGDLAYLELEGEAPPMVARVAIQQGEHAARNILRQIRGETPRPFRYRDSGMLAVIGRNSGVAHVYGRAFTGFLAWLLWLAVHIVKLIGFRNRLVVLVNWAWDYFFFERAVRLILPLGRLPPAAEPGASASREAAIPAGSAPGARRPPAPRSPGS